MHAYARQWWCVEVEQMTTVVRTLYTSPYVYMNLVYLIGLEIPDKKGLEECYYKIGFVKFDNEKDVKLSLVNLQVTKNTSEYYFVVRSKEDVVLKSKSENFYREKSIGEIGNICKYVKMCEDGTIKNVILELSNPPKTYQKDNRIRVYNQSEDKKIMHEYVNYVNIEDEKSAYMEELDQDRNMYLYVGDDWCTYIGSKTKEPNWSTRVKWSEELIKEMYKNTEFNTELCEKYEITPEEFERIKTERRRYVSSLYNKRRDTGDK
ncbi:BA75_01746T0 [Komagataella pastoris]|uniref:BA75_01746T0 n=1 Tax=Komagataella pastoris TaxID=4922 RepID=A0A1B2J7Y0_PICPA|nr:BA75_01746T0 [Komagataella pastoris]